MSGHFFNALRVSFARHANRPALIHRGETLTYAQLDAAARHSAAWLQSLGLHAGDRVILFTADKRAFLIGHLAVFYAGGIPLPLNPRFTREEMRYFLSDSSARIVIAGTGEQQLANDLAAELPHSPLVAADTMVLDPPTTIEWREPNPKADDSCLILYSSGTTGWPKGVVHSHANVANSLAALAECWRMTPEDVVVNVLPLFHIHGLAFATHLTWLTGACLLVEDAFEPQQTLDAIARGTIFMAVPQIYYRLLEEPQFRTAARAWKGVRLFTCGSAPIRAEVLPVLEEILGRPVINRYGMTEAYVITSLPLAGPWPYGSVGLPLAGIEMQVVRDNKSPAAIGEVGAVQIRGPNLFREYWNKSDATQAAFASGWFDTGDLGTLDAAGFLTLVGRKNDLIITSGYNVYPQVVERVISECPGVRECAALGLPDEKRGERVAVVVARGDSQVDETTLRAWCADRLVHYQQPKEIAFVEALPKNSLGKILRRNLPKLFANSAST